MNIRMNTIICLVFKLWFAFILIAWSCLSVESITSIVNKNEASKTLGKVISDVYVVSIDPPPHLKKFFSSLHSQSSRSNGKLPHSALIFATFATCKFSILFGLSFS